MERLFCGRRLHHIVHKSQIIPAAKRAFHEPQQRLPADDDAVLGHAREIATRVDDRQRPEEGQPGRLQHGNDFGDAMVCRVGDQTAARLEHTRGHGAKVGIDRDRRVVVRRVREHQRHAGVGHVDVEEGRMANGRIGVGGDRLRGVRGLSALGLPIGMAQLPFGVLQRDGTGQPLRRQIRRTIQNRFGSLHATFAHTMTFRGRGSTALLGDHSDLRGAPIPRIVRHLRPVALGDHGEHFFQLRGMKGPLVVRQVATCHLIAAHPDFDVLDVW